MLNWLLTMWSESDGFKIVVCVTVAVVTTLSFSDRRATMLRPFAAAFDRPTQHVKNDLVYIATSAAAVIPSPQKPSGLISRVEAKPPSQQELTDWISEVRAGCVVSFVEEIGDQQLVHKGTISAIINDTALIVWNTEMTDHPFTGGLGPDGQTESEHHIELIEKGHDLGDHGVTWDPSGVVLVASGWSVFSWPKFERLN